MMSKTWRNRLISRCLTLALAASFAGCLTPTSSRSTTATSGGSANTSTVVYASGRRSVKINFSKSAVGGGGSFLTSDVPTGVGGTVEAKQLFDVADTSGTPFVTGGTSSSSWPSWLTKVTVGTTGTGIGSTSPDCARFTDTSENLQCDTNLDGVVGGLDQQCGTAGNYFRVSEYDCNTTGGASVPADGTGAATDPVFIRIEFSRNTSYLAAHENVMAVLEFSSSSLSAHPASPDQCFDPTTGTFSPQATAWTAASPCVDFMWRIFMLNGTETSPVSFLNLAPPFINSFKYAGKANDNNKISNNITTKQFIVPLGGDSSIKYLTFSRYKSIVPDTATALGAITTPNPGQLLNHACATSPGVGKSPLCMGMIFYSLKLFRI